MSADPTMPAVPSAASDPLHIFVTGGSGVLGRALVPIATDVGHRVIAPSRAQLDLFDPSAVSAAVRGTDAVVHLATRIRPLDQLGVPAAWADNDRLRRDASRILVDAAIEAGTSVYVQPTVTFVYADEGRVTELSPTFAAPIVQSALDAEAETARFARSGGRGVVLRLGLLDGPGTGHATPVPRFGATLHVADAARALLAALTAPSAIYNVCRDGERVSNRRFIATTGWRPVR